MAKNNKFSVSEGLFLNPTASDIDAPSINNTSQQLPATTYMKKEKKGKTGRPASSTEPVQQIGFRITSKQHTAIKMYALKNNMDQSEALRKIIDESNLLKDVL